MKNKRARVYKSKKSLGAIVKPLLLILAALLVLYAILFFTLRKRMVYEGDKAYLDIPWLSEEMQDVRDRKS